MVSNSIPSIYKIKFEKKMNETWQFYEQLIHSFKLSTPNMYIKTFIKCYFKILEYFKLDCSWWSRYGLVDSVLAY